jgi:hypothetical protein
MTDRPQIHADPWDAIVGDLTSRAASGSGPPAGSDDGTPVPRVSRGRHFSAIVESVRCRKERAIQGRRFYAVIFDSEQPFPAHWHWLIAAEQHDDGWIATGGAGGAGAGRQRDRAWVNLAGWWGQDRFYAGGEIVSGPNIARVRLTTRDGTVLEDDTDTGVVLFLTDHAVELPVTLELLDATGQVVARQLDLEVPR